RATTPPTCPRARANRDPHSRVHEVHSAPSPRPGLPVPRRSERPAGARSPNQEFGPRSFPVKKIIHFVQIHAAPDRVYRALTTQDGLSGWWTTRVRAPEKVGGVISFQFTPEFGPEMQITSVEPNRLVEWKCIGGHANWKDNTFSFDLSERKGRPASPSSRSTRRS